MYYIIGKCRTLWETVEHCASLSFARICSSHLLSLQSRGEDKLFEALVRNLINWTINLNLVSWNFVDNIVGNTKRYETELQKLQKIMPCNKTGNVWMFLSLWFDWWRPFAEHSPNVVFYFCCCCFTFKLASPLSNVLGFSLLKDRIIK